VTGRGGGCIFLLSDYGQVDEFVGVLRAVAARLAPGAPVVDLTHDVAAFDVRAGAQALWRAAAHLGPGVVVAVVDPGVGGARRPVALGLGAGAGDGDGDGVTGPSALVGPDNGLLMEAAGALGGVRQAVELRRDRSVSSTTFDGRDVFVPAACALWRGEPLASLGDGLAPSDLVTLDPLLVRAGGGRLEAEVTWVDRFGNVQLAATTDHLCQAGLSGPASLQLALPGDATRGLHRVGSFAELGDLPGEGGSEPVGLLVDANGRLSLVCDRRRAATVLAVRVGDTVVVRST